MQLALLPWLALAAAFPSSCARQANYSNPFGTTVLQEGSEGAEVAALQQALNGQLDPSPDLLVNGGFGPPGNRTELAGQQADR